jgi:hypothetical protein
VRAAGGWEDKGNWPHGPLPATPTLCLNVSRTGGRFAVLISLSHSPPFPTQLKAGATEISGLGFCITD